MISWDALEIK